MNNSIETIRLYSGHGEINQSRCYQSYKQLGNQYMSTENRIIY